MEAFSVWIVFVKDSGFCVVCGQGSKHESQSKCQKHEEQAL